LRLFFRRDFVSNLLIILLLGLGLGATALLFTALDRLLLHPLPVRDQRRLVRVGEVNGPVTSWIWFPFNFYRKILPMHSLENLAVEGEVETTVTNGPSAVSATGSMVSGNYFDLLGVHPLLGRILLPADDSVTSTVPIVLSYRFWVKEFGASPTALGSTLHLTGQPFTVVGVMPKVFFGSRLDAMPDFWLPLTAQPVLSNVPLTDPKCNQTFSILGRLRQGVALAQAQSEFDSVYESAKASGKTNSHGLIAPAADGSFVLREQFGRALVLLLYGLAVLLLMVCTSVAGMLISRTVRRERETALRLALGAHHRALFRHSLMEAAVLGVLGAATGVALACACAPMLKQLLPVGQSPLPVSLIPSPMMDGMIVLVALLLSLAFGAAPSVLITRVPPLHALGSPRATRQSTALSRALLIFETGAAVMLLTSTGLLLRTMERLVHSDPGFDVQHVVSFAMKANLLNQADKKNHTWLPNQLEEEVAGLPGVRTAGLSEAEILGTFGMRTSTALPGQKFSSHEFLNTYLNSVSPNFFSALGIPVMAGRELLQEDAARSSPQPVMVNAAFARHLFGDGNPLDKQFGIGETGQVAKAQYVVVGVVGNSKYHSIRDTSVPTFYTPINRSEAEGMEIYLYVRSRQQPDAIVGIVRNALSRLAPQLPFSEIRTMQERMSESLWQERLLVAIALTFSGISILLAAMGMYGLLAYDARQRMREFGIRAALGAKHQDIAWLMLRQLLRILTPGVMFGFFGCALLARMIAPTLYGIGPYDPVAWCGALVLVTIAGLTALFQPVRTAISVDPAVTLRLE
jgi:putative ABC transport system permease protein